MLAAMKGHSALVELLLLKGGDPSLKNNVSYHVNMCIVLCSEANSIQDGKTAYDLACENGHDQVGQQLTQSDCSNM